MPRSAKFADRASPQMYRRLKTFLVVMVLSAALAAGSAHAQSCKAPPGMSAIDEYCEAIPAPGGDRGNTDADCGGAPISQATRRVLQQRGPDGQAILALVGPASQKQAKSA